MSNVPADPSERRVDDVDATDLPAQQVDPDFAVPDDDDGSEPEPDPDSPASQP